MKSKKPNNDAALALLSSVAYVLLARSKAATLAGPVLMVAGLPVANVARGVVVIRAVLDGIEGTVLPGLDSYQRTPTGNPTQASEIAIDIQVRLHVRAAEQARGDAHRAARVAGHTCGAGCVLPGCPTFARDPEVRDAA